MISSIKLLHCLAGNLGKITIIKLNVCHWLTLHVIQANLHAALTLHVCHKLICAVGKVCTFNHGPSTRSHTLGSWVRNLVVKYICRSQHQATSLLCISIYRLDLLHTLSACRSNWNT